MAHLGSSLFCVLEVAGDFQRLKKNPSSEQKKMRRFYNDICNNKAKVEVAINQIALLQKSGAQSRFTACSLSDQR